MPCSRSSTRMRTHPVRLRGLLQAGWVVVMSRPLPAACNEPAELELGGLHGSVPPCAVDGTLVGNRARLVSLILDTETATKGRATGYMRELVWSGTDCNPGLYAETVLVYGASAMGIVASSTIGAFRSDRSINRSSYAAFLRLERDWRWFYRKHPAENLTDDVPTWPGAMQHDEVRSAFREARRTAR